MFKTMFGIREYSVPGEQPESKTVFTTISIPALLARFTWAGLGAIIGWKTQILASNKYVGFKDPSFIK